MDKNIYLKNLAKKIISLTNKEGRELYRIGKIPRFTNFNTKLVGFLFEAIDSSSFLGQYNELIKRDIYKFKSSNPYPFIIDCGVNIGLSIVCLKKMHLNAKIIGFEPDPKIFEVAKKNVKTAGFSNVELIKKAVWTEETKLSFYQEGSAGGRLEKAKNDKTIQVETFDLKKIINQEVDFLKIDIEGAEFDILKDIEDNLHYVKNIFIEYHSKINNQQNLGEIINILKRKNFRYYVEDGYSNSINPFISRTEIDGFDNLLNIYAYK